MSAKLIVDGARNPPFEREFDTPSEMTAFTAGLMDGVSQSDFYDFTTEIMQKSKPNTRALRAAVLEGYDADLDHRESQSLEEAEAMAHVLYIAFGDSVEEMSREIKLAIASRNPVPTPWECFCHTVVIGFDSEAEKSAYLDGVEQGMKYQALADVHLSIEHMEDALSA